MAQTLIGRATRQGLTGPVLFFLILSIATQRMAFAQDKFRMVAQTNANLPYYGEIKVQLPDALRQKLFESHPDKDYDALISVYTGTSFRHDDKWPEVSGNFSGNQMGIVFHPTFPPPPGIQYTVLFHGNILAEWLNVDPIPRLEWTATFPELSEQPTTCISAIYPTQDTLPANLLRMYIHFSQPMGQQNPYEFLQLQHADGSVISDPFVELPEGLWDPNRQRLTVLIHPGRVKRAVGPNLTLGPVLDSGMVYKLIVKKGWKDSHGLPLQQGVRKDFTTATSLRSKVDTRQWNISQPPSNSRQPLILYFDRPMDQALTNRMIAITDPKGNVISGDHSMGHEELAWKFTPTEVWDKGSYLIRIDANLEDVAGNSLRKAFDVETHNKQDHSEASWYSMSFVVK